VSISKLKRIAEGPGWLGLLHWVRRDSE